MTPKTRYSDRFTPYGAGQMAPKEGLRDHPLQRRLKGYQAAAARRYRPVNPNRIAEELAEHEPLWISPKIDGELWFLCKRQGQVALCAADGRVLMGIPVTDEAEARLLGKDDLLIPGELYVASSPPHLRPRVHDLLAVLGDGSRAAELQFRAFDLLEEEGNDVYRTPYPTRLERLHTLLGDASKPGDRVGVVEVVEGTAEAAVGLWQEKVENGLAEGLVIRDTRGVTSKVRPVVTLDTVVLAYGERRRGDVVQLRDLIVGLARDDGSYQVVGRITRGMSDLERLQWVKRLRPMEVPSSFRLASDEGTLCRFVRPEIVVEIACVELSNQERDGSPVERMVVDYSDAVPTLEQRGGALSLFQPLIAYISDAVGFNIKGIIPNNSEDEDDKPLRYDALGQMPLLRPMHSRFVRERTDKQPGTADTGLDQLWRHMPFDGRRDAPSTRRLPPSTPLERRVFTKGSGDELKVRKYVALATHKSALDERYPPYVVHFTDYSPGRRQSLRTSVKVASSREGLDRHIQAWLDDNIKRGWDEVQ
ncbi:MAG: hypothetical protein AAFS10_23285 [Myxococcota bacterium]